MYNSGIYILIFGLVLGLMASSRAQTYQVKEGEIFFRSDAPLELIEAKSNALNGVIKADKRRFAFSIDISTFEGFNNPLQQVHFNENYLESDLYPEANFSGRIIESIDLTEDGNYDVRAKGVLEIHGVQQERIIKGRLNIMEDGSLCKVYAQFTVILDEHNISIPKIVNQKIAEEIYVEVKGSLERQ